MTTAKPEPMAGQSDASDDLIAELAKLMAQDAQGNDRPAPAATPSQPAARPAPPPTIRIPGGDLPPPPPAPTSAAVPRFDLSQPAPVQAAPVAPQRPVPQSEPKPATPPAEPFAFDFDLGNRQPQGAASAVPQPTAPVAAERVEPTAPAPVQTSEPADQHDSIADLIAAELLNDTAEPEPVQAINPVPVAVQPQPVTPPPAAASGADRFVVPPVFGLGGRTQSAPGPVAPAPRPQPAQSTPARVEPALFTRPTPTPQPDDAVGQDPVDEIEGLIGRSVDNGAVPPSAPVAAPPRSVPQPPVRSLATPTARPPRTEPGFSAAPHRGLSGADEAVLAAAAATGANVGWADPEDDGMEPIAAGAAQRAPRSFKLGRSVAGPLVAVTLLLAAGVGLYWVLGQGGGQSEPPPLITADTTPVREEPVADPDAANPQQSVVFNEIDGVAPPADEQLVSRDQADVNEVTQVAAPAVTDEGLANRRVRTVTVRPDGTIVSGEDSVAGSAMLPVERPNVPAVPGAATASPELLASTATATDTPTPTAAVPETPATPAVPPVQPGATVPAVDSAGNPLAGRTTTIPLTRPTTFPPQTINTTPSPVTAALPASAAQTPIATSAAPTAAMPAPSAEQEVVLSNAPAYVQLASQRTEDEARQTAESLVSRFGPLFGGANMEVQRVDLGARGIYYRVRVPATSLQNATEMCGQVQAAGGECFAM